MRRIIPLAFLLVSGLSLAATRPDIRNGEPDPAESRPYDCTVSVKVYILTETGLIGIGFSITAGSCPEAYQGIRSAVSGFLKAL